MCLLGLFSVLKDQVLSFYPDVGDFNHKNLFNCHITPRTSSINQKCFKIFFCRNEPFGTFVKSAKFQSNHFVPLLTTIQKRKKNNPSHTNCVLLFSYFLCVRQSTYFLTSLTEESVVNNFCKYFFANCRSASPA